MTLLGAWTEACMAKRSTRRTAMKITTIGAITTYIGSEHRYLRGYRVRIVAVLKADGNIIKDEDDLARAGGVTAEDRVEVQPWLEAEGRFSFVTSDSRAVDLACFERLRASPERVRAPRGTRTPTRERWARS